MKKKKPYQDEAERLVRTVDELYTQEKHEARLREKLDEQLYNNLPRKKVSNTSDINIKKYKRHESYRGDSPLDD